VVHDDDRDQALLAHPRLDARDPLVSNVHLAAQS